MKIDGRCHCGYITYEAEIEPEKVMICHCADCQTLSGSAFRTVAFTKKGTFKLLSGELKVYVKTGGSGTKPTIVLPRMRNAHLFKHAWRGAKSPCHPHRDRSPTRPTCAESATLVSLRAGLGHRSGLNSPDRKATCLRCEGRGSLRTANGMARPCSAVNLLDRCREA